MHADDAPPIRGLISIKSFKLPLTSTMTWAIQCPKAPEQMQKYRSQQTLPFEISKCSRLMSLPHTLTCFSSEAADRNIALARLTQISAVNSLPSIKGRNTTS